MMNDEFRVLRTAILLRDAGVIVPYKYTFLRATVGADDLGSPLIVRA